MGYHLTDSDKTDFLKIEYQKAIETYFSGVNIGITWFRYYLFLNGIFFAICGTIITIDSGNRSKENYLYVVDLVSAFAIITSIILWSITPYYRTHMNNCASRCKEIENMFDGKLFHRIVAIGDDRRRTFSAVSYLFLFFLAFIVIWLSVVILINM